MEQKRYPDKMYHCGLVILFSIIPFLHCIAFFHLSKFHNEKKNKRLAWLSVIIPCLLIIIDIIDIIETYLTLFCTYIIFTEIANKMRREYEISREIGRGIDSVYGNAAININSATIEELSVMTEVPAAVMMDALAYRARKGGFASVEEFFNVINASTYIAEKYGSMLCVRSTKPALQIWKGIAGNVSIVLALFNLIIPVLAIGISLTADSTLNGLLTQAVFVLMLIGGIESVSTRKFNTVGSCIALVELFGLATLLSVFLLRKPAEFGPDYVTLLLFYAAWCLANTVVALVVLIKSKRSSAGAGNA